MILEFLSSKRKSDLSDLIDLIIVVKVSSTLSICQIWIQTTLFTVRVVHVNRGPIRGNYGSLRVWFINYKVWIWTFFSRFQSPNSYLWRFQFNPRWHFLKWRIETKEGSWRLKWYELAKVIQGQIRIWTLKKI